jgi:hypothetical protein
MVLKGKVEHHLKYRNQCVVAMILILNSCWLDMQKEPHIIVATLKFCEAYYVLKKI